MPIIEYVEVLSATTLQYLSTNIDEIESKPILLLMHGFPECSWAWETYLNDLASDYCVVAPDLPGYRFSEGFSEPTDYNMQRLIATMSEFIEVLLHRSAQVKLHLVAHDWGGAIAWPLAAFNSELLHSLSIINAAHPSTFTREMNDNLVQQEKSEYIADFMHFDAVSKIQADGAMMFKRLLGKQFFAVAIDMETEKEFALKFSPEKNTNQSLFSARQLLEYTKQWMDPDSLENMLNYYRCMPQVKTKGYSSQAGPLRVPNIRIKVPTLVIWGENDSAFVIENLKGLDEWVDNLRIHRIAGASHWVHHEKSAEVMSTLRHFLSSSIVN